MAATKLTAPNGAKVSVDSARVDGLLKRGFTKAESATKAPAKKAASSKSNDEK